MALSIQCTLFGQTVNLAQITLGNQWNEQLHNSSHFSTADTESLLNNALEMADPELGITKCYHCKNRGDLLAPDENVCLVKCNKKIEKRELEGEKNSRIQIVLNLEIKTGSYEKDYNQNQPAKKNESNDQSEDDNESRKKSQNSNYSEISALSFDNRPPPPVIDIVDDNDNDLPPSELGITKCYYCENKRPLLTPNEEQKSFWREFEEKDAGKNIKYCDECMIRCNITIEKRKLKRMRDSRIQKPLNSESESGSYEKDFTLEPTENLPESTISSIDHNDNESRSSDGSSVSTIRRKTPITHDSSADSSLIITLPTEQNKPSRKFRGSKKTSPKKRPAESDVDSEYSSGLDVLFDHNESRSLDGSSERTVCRKTPTMDDNSQDSSLTVTSPTEQNKPSRKKRPAESDDDSESELNVKQNQPAKKNKSNEQSNENNQSRENSQSSDYSEISALSFDNEPSPPVVVIVDDSDDDLPQPDIVKKTV